MDLTERMMKTGHTIILWTLCVSWHVACSLCT